MLYTQEELINFAISGLNSIEKKNKLSVIQPDIKFKNHRTIFSNFYQVCKSLDRGDEYEIYHIQKYLQTESAMAISIDEDNQLIIVGNLKLPQIQKLIANYFRDFIQCKTCNSQFTKIIKNDRLYCIKCNHCNQSNAVINY